MPRPNASSSRRPGRPMRCESGGPRKELELQRQQEELDAEGKEERQRQWAEKEAEVLEWPELQLRRA